MGDQPEKEVSMSDRAIVSSTEMISERQADPIGTIGIPMRDSINAQTMLSLMRTDWPGQVDKLWSQGNALVMQRNNLVQRMRGEWILFIDDDMVWEPGAVRALLETRAALEEQGYVPDVLSALCFRRTEPHQPTLFFRQKDGPYNFMEAWDEDVVEVDATGMAFALVTKKAFERIAGTEMPPYEVRVAGSRTPDFFRWYGGLGEDLRFCEDVKKAGGHIYVDTRILIGHVAEKTVGIRDFWREIAERSETDQANRERINREMGLMTMSQEQARERLYG